MLEKILITGALTAILLAAAAGVSAQVAPQPAAQPAAQPTTDARDGFDLSADVGAGVLEFFHLDVTYLTSGRQLRRLLAFGVGVGGFPLDKALSVLMKTDDLSASARMQGITLKGSVETQLVSFRLFGRWFPFRKAFFTELSGEAWRLRVKTVGTVTSDDYGELIEVKAKAEVWVPMIGLHGGWRILWKNGAFLEIAGGLNVFLSPGAEVTLGGTTIDQLAGFEEAQATLSQTQKFLSDAVEDGANRITKKVKVFPTGTLRFGWAFDAW
ncbi:MAG: hypothetical protein M0R80_29180 [Proteobacteria bacterium]|jgi:hypothetical protein|nr:hypothetical protein [Pseudomonadota bacterium]